MLTVIAKTIGGNVRIVEKVKFVIWVVNNKKEIQKIIKIFTMFPPITSRLKAQLEFMLKCFNLNDVSWYLSNRNYKYLISKNKVLKLDKFYLNNLNNLNNYNYFNEWLSGFIEAEGCFSIRKTHNNFSIGQKGDKYILEAIKEHFHITNKVRCIKDNFYILEVYRKSILINIMDHCYKYPLLGEKMLSFNKFKDLF